MSGPVVALVIDRPASAGPSLAADVQAILGRQAHVELVADPAEASARAVAIEAADGLVPLVFIDGEHDCASQTVIAVHDAPGLRTSRIVLVTTSPSLGGVDLALRRGAVHGMITRPWTADGLEAQVRANLAVFLLEHAPERFGEFGTLLDQETRDRAEHRLNERRSAPVNPTTGIPLLLDQTISDADVEQRMIQLFDRALGHPPRIRVAPGTILIESGDDVGGIYVLLEGVVKLSSQTSTGERILHQQSTGAIVGLLSLASRRRAMLRCRAVTEVRAVPITLNQLAQAMASEPELSSLLNRVLISSLAKRLRRSDELQVELDRSLSDLAEARAQLVATARFTALGEMAAGMAHELNNPTAALARSAEHVRDDIAELLGGDPVGPVVDQRLDEATPLPSQKRALRRQLVNDGIDPAVATRLVDAGFVDHDEAATVAELDEHQQRRTSAASRLGRSLRSVNDATLQIQTLVGSLRSYVRGEDGKGPLIPDVDVAATIDDAVRLVAHRLADVEIHRQFTPTPGIVTRPGALQQVWTNLITNAIEAMGDGGGEQTPTLHITVAPAANDMVEIHVIDNGPGVPPDMLERIFEPRFTTKHGRVQFGLGLGLSISRQLIEDHGGQIDVETRPGHTDFRVLLPQGGPT